MGQLYNERMHIGQCCTFIDRRNFLFKTELLQLIRMNLKHNVHVFLFVAFSVQVLRSSTETIAVQHSPMAILSCHSESTACQAVDKLNFCFKIYIEFVWASRIPGSRPRSRHLWKKQSMSSMFHTVAP